MYKDESILATQKAMAQLVDCYSDNIGLHLKNIFASGELVKESHSGKLTEENLMKHGFLRAPVGIKIMEGDLLKFIERKF